MIDKPCPVTNAPTGKHALTPKTLFMASGWRLQLCKCDTCNTMYSEKQMEFLLDPEDTVHHYEEKSKKETGSQYESGMKALSEMDRTKQVEAIHSYNSMKGDLMEYFKTFAEEGKVVTQEDIKKFFASKSKDAKKRPRVEIPKFCK